MTDRKAALEALDEAISMIQPRPGTRLDELLATISAALAAPTEPVATLRLTELLRDAANALEACHSANVDLLRRRLAPTDAEREALIARLLRAAGPPPHEADAALYAEAARLLRAAPGDERPVAWLDPEYGWTVAEPTSKA